MLALVADPAGDGFVSGGDDGRLLRIAADGTATELANQKGKWIEQARRPSRDRRHRRLGRQERLRRRQDGEVREFGPHQSTVAALDFSKDGSRIACAHYGGVTVWSIGQVTLPPRRFAWRGSHVALKWSTDGKFIATGTQENDIHVWRMAQATDMRMQGYPAKVKSLSWTADARLLYTSSQPVFTAWPFSGKGPEGKPPLQFGEEGAGLLTVVAAHPAAEFVAGGYDLGELQLGDIKTRRSVVLKMADGSAITCLAWSPDGFRLAVGNDSGDLLVVDLGARPSRFLPSLRADQQAVAEEARARRRSPMRGRSWARWCRRRPGRRSRRTAAPMPNCMTPISDEAVPAMCG